jgi:hypothetical protein
MSEKKQRKGGATLTNADRRANGLTRVAVWLDADELARLDALAPTRAEGIRRLLRVIGTLKGRMIRSRP